MSPAKVSIIVPTKNEEKNIERLLRSIKEQTYKNIETIVIDNNSSDNTQKLAKKYTKNIFNKGPERSAQRNFGAKKATGKYLLFLDADMELGKNVVTECVELINSNKKIGTVTIPEIPVAYNFWEQVKKHEREFYNLAGDESVESARFFPKNLFQKVGGYDTNITGPEDWDLPERIIDLGYQNARIKSKIKHFEKIPNLFSLLKKKYYYGLKSHVYLEKNNISVVSAKTIYFLRPVFYKNWQKLFSKPLLSLAMLFMLFCEQFAGGLGYLKGKIFKSNNILILTAHFSPNMGGVETHLDDLVSSLSNRNFKVSVLTYQPLTTKVDYKMHECRDNIEIFRIPWMRDLFYKLVKYPAIEFLYLFPGLFLALPLVIIKNRPSIIHSHGLVAGGVGLLWSKIFGLKSVITTHSLYEFPKSGLYHNFSKFIFRLSDKILTLSKQSKMEIEKLTNREDIEIFTYWIDLEKFKSSKAKSKKFTILFVGRLVNIKGVNELLKAASEWNNNIELKIAGGGPLESKVKKFAKKYKNINYLGRLKGKKLVDEYSSAHLVIVPSINEEGFGRVILEALACGTSVIASKKGGIPEAMDNTVGDFFDPTPTEIKLKVEYYYKHRKVLNKKADHARKYAEKHYSEKNVEKIISSFR